MDDSTIYVVFNKDTNLSEEVLSSIVERRAKFLYDSYHIPYKLLYTTVDLNILKPLDHVLLHQYCFKKMEWNTNYVTTYEDIERILRVEKTRELLKEIDQCDKLSHPAIQVFCQPILDTHSGTYKSIEILSRLQVGDDLVMPSEFLPIAEYYSYNYNYNKKVFGQACKKFAELMHEDIPVERMSMNFSIQEFTNPDFISDVLYIIKKYGVPGEKVAIEITESVGANAPAETLRKIIWKLKARGIKVYLDDFGVDYSNLDRILHLPVDVIKFDSCITWSLRDNSTLKPIVSTMADSFRRAGYEVLFEGVETEEDELRCQHLNASYLQGYKYAKPMELDSLVDFLQ
jgi:EAL domain-containing protein (putative c-di-GMP-specific phosphodiesterase class I)